MKKVFLLAASILFVGCLLSVFITFRFGKKCTCYGKEIDGKCVGVKTTCLGLAPNIPLEGFQQNNEVLKIQFNGTTLETGDTFNFNPSEHCLGDLKARLTNIYDNAISVDILEEQGLNGNYYETKPHRTITIKDGDCVIGNPLCMDVVYKYCFSIESSTKPTKYSYDIKGESTMPLPNSK
jgi:hypothetical protein